MQEIWLIFKGLRRGDWASLPDRNDAYTASLQWLASLAKGATLSGAPQTPETSLYGRQRGAGTEYGP